MLYVHTSYLLMSLMHIYFSQSNCFQHIWSVIQWMFKELYSVHSTLTIINVLHSQFTFSSIQYVVLYFLHMLHKVRVLLMSEDLFVVSNIIYSCNNQLTTIKANSSFIVTWSTQVKSS